MTVRLSSMPCRIVGTSHRHPRDTHAASLMRVAFVCRARCTIARAELFFPVLSQRREGSSSVPGPPFFSPPLLLFTFAFVTLFSHHLSLFLVLLSIIFFFLAIFCLFYLLEELTT